RGGAPRQRHRGGGGPPRGSQGGGRGAGARERGRGGRGPAGRRGPGGPGREPRRSPWPRRAAAGTRRNGAGGGHRPGPASARERERGAPVVRGAPVPGAAGQPPLLRASTRSGLRQSGSSKYFFVSITMTPESTTRPIRLGTAIRPLATSLKAQARLSSEV